MVKLKHWDNVQSFTGREISLLLMGLDPSNKDSSLFDSEHLLGPIRNGYIAAIWRARKEIGLSVGMLRNAADIDDSITSSGTLSSIDLLLAHEGWFDEGMEEEFAGWLQHKKSAFEFQRFSRSEVVNWLIANNVTSEYQFYKQCDGMADSKALKLPLPALPPTVDPEDLPIELDVGRIAFQAVQNGYGNQTATFRNRLVEFIEENYKGLTGETVKRIATVANPDKTTGRKKKTKE
jgi:hypothetical protein